MSSVKKPFIFQEKVYAEHVSPSQKHQVAQLVHKLKRRGAKGKIMKKLALKQTEIATHTPKIIKSYSNKIKVITKKAPKKSSQFIASKFNKKTFKVVRSYAAKSPQQYTVKRGDTLKSISSMVYGTDLLWETIYKINKKTIGDDPDQLKMGLSINTGSSLTKQNMGLAH